MNYPIQEISIIDFFIVKRIDLFLTVLFYSYCIKDDNLLVIGRNALNLFWCGNDLFKIQRFFSYVFNNSSSLNYDSKYTFLTSRKMRMLENYKFLKLLNTKNRVTTTLTWTPNLKIENF